MLEEEWKENFRMSKSTFLKLCDAVRPFLVKQCTNMRMAVSVEKQVAVSVIVRRVCTVISTVLSSIYYTTQD